MSMHTLTEPDESFRRLVVAAIDELAALRSPDPHATIAMSVVELMLHNLRDLLPLTS
ncbi:MAG TPA: hypothetical protein VMM60_09260 [Ilumatobacter sp.]|nr:hypothetical protein [Ilumatobacter sp.]